MPGRIVYIETNTMSITRQLLTSAALVVFTSAFCAAQSVAPAHSGTVHYFEGDVTVDGVKLVSQVARFAEMKEQSVLKTGMGRAEILLTPGVLLRVGENSSFKMLDNRLLSTRVEFLSGTAMVEAVDSGTSVKDPPVTIVYKDFEAQQVRFGIFELKSEPQGQVRVFKGEAKVTGNNASVNVKEGNMIDLTTTMAVAKFDAKDGDDLYVWSRDRSAYLSAGNMSSARTLGTSGYGSGIGCASGFGNTGMLTGYGSGMGYPGNYASACSGWNPSMWNGFAGGWYYNPYLNMYSYMPFAGTMYSPFGYGYYNPVTVAYVYTPGYYWAGSGGPVTGATTGLPLSTTSATGPKGVSQLPRLGVTAAVRPTLSNPARGTEPGAPTASLSARNGSGFGNSSSSLSSGLGSSSSNARPTTASAPSMGASTARAGSGKR
jgi:hypothetical protein